MSKKRMTVSERDTRIKTLNVLKNKLEYGLLLAGLTKQREEQTAAYHFFNANNEGIRGVKVTVEVGYAEEVTDKAEVVKSSFEIILDHPKIQKALNQARTAGEYKDGLEKGIRAGDTSTAKYLNTFLGSFQNLVSKRNNEAHNLLLSHTPFNKAREDWGINPSAGAAIELKKVVKELAEHEAYFKKLEAADAEPAK